MINIVPSKHMKAYLEEIEHEFSDFEKATLIWNAKEATWREKLEALGELAKQTSDYVIKTQIEERIAYEEKQWNRFLENSDKKYIYVVTDEFHYSCGFFVECKLAMNYALDNIKKHQDRYSVEKHLLVMEEPFPMMRAPGRFNLHLFGENSNEEYVEYEGVEVARVDFGLEGDILRVWSNEMTREEMQVDEFCKERFEYHFIDIPIPYPGFKKGMPVRCLYDDTYGIIATSEEEWKEFCKKVSAGLYVDYSDMSIEVVFLTEEGCWSHEHINPLYLEVDIPPLSDDRIVPMEALSDYWAERGHEGGEDIVLRACQEYARKCRKKGTVKYAEDALSLRDIIL